MKIALKKCSKCGESKPATPEYFHRNKSNNDGLRYDCKECSERYNQSEKGKERTRRYQQSDKGKESNIKYRQSDKRKKYQREYHKKYQQKKKQEGAK